MVVKQKVFPFWHLVNLVEISYPLFIQIQISIRVGQSSCKGQNSTYYMVVHGTLSFSET